MDPIFICDSCGFGCYTAASFNFHIMTEHLPREDNTKKRGKRKDPRMSS